MRKSQLLSLICLISASRNCHCHLKTSVLHDHELSSMCNISGRYWWYRRRRKVPKQMWYMYVFMFPRNWLQDIKRVVEHLQTANSQAGSTLRHITHRDAQGFKGNWKWATGSGRQKNLASVESASSEGTSRVTDHTVAFLSVERLELTSGETFGQKLSLVNTWSWFDQDRWWLRPWHTVRLQIDKFISCSWVFLTLTVDKHTKVVCKEMVVVLNPTEPFTPQC